jgi:hypothetical protein
MITRESIIMKNASIENKTPLNNIKLLLALIGIILGTIFLIINIISIITGENNLLGTLIGAIVVLLFFIPSVIYVKKQYNTYGRIKFSSNKPKTNSSKNGTFESRYLFRLEDEKKKVSKEKLMQEIIKEFHSMNHKAKVEDKVINYIIEKRQGKFDMTLKIEKNEDAYILENNGVFNLKGMYILEALGTTGVNAYAAKNVSEMDRLKKEGCKEEAKAVIHNVAIKLGLKLEV